MSICFAFMGINELSNFCNVGFTKAGMKEKAKATWKVKLGVFSSKYSSLSFSNVHVCFLPS